MFVMLITYSFDSDYVAVKCETEKEAIDKLNEYLDEEIKTVEEESEYTPVVREHMDTLKELIYEEDEAYIDSDTDIAEYRVIEVK
jgi:hypothetical protein